MTIRWDEFWFKSTIALMALVACSKTPSAAESAYTTELLRCTDKSTTLAESRACQDDVDRRWGIMPRVRDGGAP